jgi:hypothetical protein
VGHPDGFFRRPDRSGRDAHGRFAETSRNLSERGPAAQAPAKDMRGRE